jgi:hypothetical protein
MKSYELRRVFGGTAGSEDPPIIKCYFGDEYDELGGCAGPGLRKPVLPLGPVTQKTN